MELQGETGWENFDIVVDGNKWPDAFPCSGNILLVEVGLRDANKAFSIQVCDKTLTEKDFRDPIGQECDWPVTGTLIVKQCVNTILLPTFKKGNTLNILSGKENIYRITIWVKQHEGN